MQSNEDGNRGKPSSPQPRGLGDDPLRYPLSNPLVWPCSVELSEVFSECAMRWSVPGGQQVIEAFSPHALKGPFADRVGLWSAVGRLQDFNSRMS